MSPTLNFHSLFSPIIKGDPSLPGNSIYFVHTAIIISSISTPTHISSLWTYISTHVLDETQQLIIAGRIREGLLKSCPLAGYPRGINSLNALLCAIQSTSPSIATTYTASASLRAPITQSELETRGTALFNRIYGKVAPRIQESMRVSSGGDLDVVVLRSVYGELMAEESILDARETALLEFVVCLVVGAQPQAKGHFYGCTNVGNEKGVVGGAVRLARMLGRELAIRLDFEEGEGWEFLQGVESW